MYYWSYSKDSHEDDEPVLLGYKGLAECAH